MHEMLCIDALAVVWRQKRIRHDVMQLQYSTVLYSTLQYWKFATRCTDRQTCAMRLSSTDLPAPLWPTTRSLWRTRQRNETSHRRVRKENAGERCL